MRKTATAMTAAGMVGGDGLAGFEADIGIGGAENQGQKEAEHDGLHVISGCCGVAGIEPTLAERRGPAQE